MVLQIVISFIDLFFLFLCLKKSKASLRISLGYIIPTLIVIYFNRKSLFKTGLSMHINSTVFLIVTGVVLAYTAIYLLLNTKKINSKTSVMFLIMVVLLLSTSAVATRVINYNFPGYNVYYHNIRQFIFMYIYLLLSIGLMSLILINGAKRPTKLKKSRI